MVYDHQFIVFEVNVGSHKRTVKWGLEGGALIENLEAMTLTF